MQTCQFNNHESCQSCAAIIREDQSLISAAMLKARIAGALGGRAAEQLVFGTDQVGFLCKNGTVTLVQAHPRTPH